jgi:methylenetetrahydrofolate dehydrogenase (NADP+)/methenyltetrahydrofolate cyclohydrolase
MTARIIDGKAVAEFRRATLATRVAAASFKPGLRVVLLGEHPASRAYVGAKQKAAIAAGFDSETIRRPETTTQAELLALIAELNAAPEVDGILVQLPLPAHIDADAVIEAIDPAKDVDGFHPVNAGRLAAGRPALVPCTPLGVMHLLAHAGVALRGARAVVLGRSAIVGRPMASLLLGADATVTIAHSRTRDLPALCRTAEVLVAAVGRPEMVQADWVAPGATVIDVGINRVGEKLVGEKLVGDVAYAAAAEVAGAITPVPGGVGPMTIACLLENTFDAALARRA